MLGILGKVRVRALWACMARSAITSPLPRLTHLCSTPCFPCLQVGAFIVSIPNCVLGGMTVSTSGLRVAHGHRLCSRMDG